MEKPLVVGIAGGSGSGKTTLAIRLCKSDPDRYALVHLDDYFKKKEEVPVLDGIVNWEDPSALKFDDLYHDLQSLIRGEAITVRTKSELYHPTYHHSTGGKIDYTITPKPVILVEGYLVFHDKRIRDLCDVKLYLDTDIRTSAKRRSPTKDPVDDAYIEKILVPAHRTLVEPTKAYADVVIDVTNLTPEAVQQEALRAIQ